MPRPDTIDQGGAPRHWAF